MCFRPAEANLSQPIKCPICGKINRPDAVSCVKCGATAEDMAAAHTAPPVPSAKPAPSAPQPKKSTSEAQ